LTAVDRRPINDRQTIGDRSSTCAAKTNPGGLFGRHDTREAAVDTRQLRRERTLARILEAGWELAAEVGLAGVSLRELARRVEMRQPSLYTYFDSKNGLYDAMFATAYDDLLRRMREDDPPAEPRAWLRHSIRFFMAWVVERPARFQLLFQRTVPGFQPSPGSYAIAIEVEHHFVASLEQRGFDGATANPIWGLILVGLADQHIANDPGGDRWEVLVDDLSEMFLAVGRPASGARQR
jgi:AcrR family transcriptional regulator